ncbi:MAG: hypothetical protein II627_08000 [Lachnospiraceae bacterium]|nr:hypothetical protein [Lachnospiraceae bacterium]
MKRIVCVIALAMVLCMAVPGYAEAEAGSVDMGDVIQMGDFEGKDHYIVFYPKELEGSDKQYPVLVWANGTMCAPVLYMNLLKGVAARGYVVVASSELMSADGKAQIKAIDYIFDQSMDESSVLCGKIDPGKIGAFGHSQGGRSSVNAAAEDERIGCLVSIAGSNYTSEAKKLSTPALFLTGTKDLVVLSSLWVKPAYDNVRGPAVYASAKNAIHTTCVLDADKYIDYCASWFDAWLLGDQTAMARFKSGGALSKDSGWTDYASKNMASPGLTGTAFSGGNVWSVLALGELIVIAALIALLIRKKKKA